MKFITNEQQQEITQHVTDQLPFAIHGGQLIKEQNAQIMPHWHNEFQIVWIQTGCLDYTIEDRTITLNESAGLFINSAILHSARPVTDSVDYLCINFSPQFIGEIFYENILKAIAKNTSLSAQLLRFSTIQQSFLTELAQTQQLESPLKLYAFLCDILSRLDQPSVANQPLPKPIYPLLDYVHQHAFEPLTVAQIAASSGINKNKCTALFKQYTSLSPINYLIAYRLEQARDLLQTTDWSISEIASFVGFNQLSYFITKFKARYKHTPLQFRNQHLADQKRKHD